MKPRIIFRGARIFDGESADLQTRDVLVENDRISAVSPAVPEDDGEAEIIDCAGRVLMPGLIDAHVHVYAYTVNIGRAVQAPLSYAAHFAAQFMHSSLDRGFTTLRDVGGADVGLASAIKDGLLGSVPRLFYGGRVISQTGGHGDFRPGDHALDSDDYCGCAGRVDLLTVIADGVDAMRRAVREEFRRGASHIKLMASGGVASPTDPLDKCQYSPEEIRAAVEEADRRGAYIAAHCHPAEAVRQAAMLGVRSIEHATLIDKETADLVVEKGAFVVPTMAVGASLVAEGEKLGFPPVSMDKMRRLADRALASLEVMKQAGVKMALGTDLLGALYVRQSSEFALRGQVLPAIDILRSACSIGAELLGQTGQLGCIRPGALADLLVVEGNPLKDITILAKGGESLAVIMTNGRFHKRTI